MPVVASARPPSSPLPPSPTGGQQQWPAHSFDPTDHAHHRYLFQHSLSPPDADDNDDKPAAGPGSARYFSQHHRRVGRPTIDLSTASSTSTAHVRSLTESAASSSSSIPNSPSLSSEHGSDNSMAAVDSAAPSSPPELSMSHSSTKSSNTPSTILSDDPHEISNFEDISLAEVKNEYSFQKDTKTSPTARPRPTVRTALAKTPSPRSSTANLREKNAHGLKSTSRPNIADKGLRSPTSARPSWQRGYTTQGLSPPGPHEARRRAPSPTKTPVSASASTASLTRCHTNPENPAPLSRTTSWQPQRRKTAKELEDEYHDSDDELPEDAVVWNIPLTPRPGDTRSPSQSPDRGPGPASGDLKKPKAKKPGMMRVRTKSWHEALSDLSREAKDLTVALESHADLSSALERRKSAPDDAGAVTPPQRSNTAAAQSTRFQPITLPPIQKFDGLIDPLPPSKEKEKHLTRTRPSWLPPKNPAEERKHLKEYQKMMAAFLAAEKRRSAASTASTNSADSSSSESQTSTAPRSKSTPNKTQDEALTIRTWETRVLADWDRAIRAPRTRELWWSGIPASLRGRVWAKAIGNDLHLSPASYHAALARVRSSPSSASPQPPDFSPSVSTTEHTAPARLARTQARIAADIPTTFPSLQLFQPEQPLHDALVSLCTAYASYRSDTGYVKGIAALAALLLYWIAGGPGATMHSTSGAEELAFIALANLLQRPLCLAFCLRDPHAMSKYVAQAQTAVGYKLPALKERVGRMPLAAGRKVASRTGAGAPEFVLEPLLRSLGTALLAPDECARVWDVLVFEGDLAMVRAAVGVLRQVEARVGKAPTVTEGQEEADDPLAGLLAWRAEGDAYLDVGGPDTLMMAVRWAGKAEDGKGQLKLSEGKS